MNSFHAPGEWGEWRCWDPLFLCGRGGRSVMDDGCIEEEEEDREVGRKVV